MLRNALRLRALAAMLTLVLSQAIAMAADSDRPNIVFIMSDELAYFEVG